MGGGAGISAGATVIVGSGYTGFPAQDFGLTDFTVEVASGGLVTRDEFGGTAVLKVLSGGVASVTQVYGTGVEYVSSGGTAEAMTIGIGFLPSTGGSATILSGGIDIGTQINSGGFELVSSGGIVSSATISGGTLEVASGGSIGSAPVTFATSGGGILQLDDSVHFGGLVAGFGKPDFLDLRDIAFTSATTLSWTQLTSGASASGTLTVSGGGNVANITLLGQYVVGQFTSASDGHGGTLVGDPPVVAQTEVASNTLAVAHT